MVPLIMSGDSYNEWYLRTESQTHNRASVPFQEEAQEFTALFLGLPHLQRAPALLPLSVYILGLSPGSFSSCSFAPQGEVPKSSAEVPA